MNKKQAKKLYGVNGTKRLRKEWGKAVSRGKTPNQHLEELRKQKL